MEAKPKNSPLPGFIDDHFLLVFVDGGDADSAGDHDVGHARIAGLVDALARGEGFDFDLTGENGGLVVIEQGKERNAFQNFGLACSW